jgi:SIR2-like domain
VADLEPQDVALVVGAGISRSPPTNAPDFRELRDSFLKLADPSIDPERFELDELSPEQVFDALDDGTEELRRSVKRELWWRCESGAPNPNHYAVATLLRAGARVWTPNYDTMIERAAERLRIAIRSVTPGDSLDRDDVPELLKPHGSFPYGGDPPAEPVSHDYPLLFRASEVWLLDEDWAARLRDDLRGRHVFLYGYRGADPDLVLPLVDAFHNARTVEWWEFPNVPNYGRLTRWLANSPVRLRAGNPSDALQALAAELVGFDASDLTAADGAALSRSRPRIALSYLSRAGLLGQFLGSSAARKMLRKAILRDRGGRKRAARLLVRSAGYDIAWVRTPLLLLLGGLLRLPNPYLSQLQELYVTLVDSRPLRPADRRAVENVRRRTRGGRGAILVRLASKEKLLGDLDAAVADAEAARRSLDVADPEGPQLEAMAVYNLAWIYRQRAEFDVRRGLLDDYAERMPHIGFNWAAWIELDEALAALNLGDLALARKHSAEPFLDYARGLIAHPLYRLDDDLVRAQLEWYEEGPGPSVERELQQIVDSYTPYGRWRRPSFTLLNTIILLGDHARATGDHARMRSYLVRARQKTASKLQSAQIELVDAVAEGDRRRLERLRAAARDVSFGLIAATVDAVLGDTPAARVAYASSRPLAGTY